MVKFLAFQPGKLLNYFNQDVLLLHGSRRITEKNHMHMFGKNNSYVIVIFTLIVILSCFQLPNTSKHVNFGCE